MSNAQIIIQQHKDSVGARSRQLRARLRPVMGITWNMRGRRFVPLGTATMMVMSYHPQRIELTAVTAEVDSRGLISYGNVKMSHNFAICPQTGGRWKALDPRDHDDPSVTGRDRPNASWVRLALGVDAQCVDGAASPHELPVVPQLPHFWAGFRNKEGCTPAVTTAAVATLLEALGESPSRAASMAVSEKSELLSRHWNDLWVGPDAKGNPTGYWLIRTEFVGRLRQASKLYEDFSNMLGVDCPNPTLGLVDVKFANPARRCAAKRGVDLSNLSEDQIQYLVGDMRQELGEHRKVFNESEIRRLIECPDQPVTLPFRDGAMVDLLVDDIVEQIRRVVLIRHPELYDSLTTEDILTAIEHADQPMRVAGACPIQVLAWNTEMEPADAFRFSSRVLGRPGVAAELWPGEAFEASKGGRNARRMGATAAAR